MITYVVLFRGQEWPGAKPVAVSFDPDLAAYVAQAILGAPERGEERDDPVLAPIVIGRRAALKMVALEAGGAEPA